MRLILSSNRFGLVDPARMGERLYYFLGGIGLIVVLAFLGWFVGRLLQIF
jgi:hypothetical protein